MRAFLLVLLMTGCGSSGGGDAGLTAGEKTGEKSPDATTDVASSQTFSMLVENAGALPACTAETEGRLAYVKSDSAFQACSGGVWSVIDIKGEKGDAGKDGQDGKDGKDAEAPRGAAIVAIYTCGPSDDLETDDADVETIGMGARITQFDTGDYHMSCLDRRVNLAYFDSDVSSDSIVFAHDSVAIEADRITCSAFYTSADFLITSESMKWRALSGSGSQLVPCKKDYEPNP